MAHPNSASTRGPSHASALISHHSYSNMPSDHQTHLYRELDRASSTCCLLVSSRSPISRTRVLPDIPTPAALSHSHETAANLSPIDIPNHYPCSFLFTNILRIFADVYLHRLGDGFESGAAAMCAAQLPRPLYKLIDRNDMRERNIRL